MQQSAAILRQADRARLLALAVGLALLVVGCGGWRDGSTAGQTEPSSERLDADENLLEEAYLRFPLSDEDGRYASIDGRKMKDLLRQVTAISRTTRDDRTKYWGRIAGTEGEARARDWVEAKFREHVAHE